MCIRVVFFSFTVFFFLVEIPPNQYGMWPSINNVFFITIYKEHDNRIVPN